MSLAKRIAARMLGAKKPVKPPAHCSCKPNPFQCGSGCRCSGCGHRPAVAALKARPAPRPSPELAQVVAALPLPPPIHEVPPAVVHAGWVGSCKAICADSGRRCRLPAHPGQAHRHERGEFFRIADPNQTQFTAREQLDRAATRRTTTETI